MEESYRKKEESVENGAPPATFIIVFESWKKMSGVCTEFIEALNKMLNPKKDGENFCVICFKYGVCNILHHPMARALQQKWEEANMGQKRVTCRATVRWLARCRKEYLKEENDDTAEPAAKRMRLDTSDAESSDSN